MKWLAPIHEYDVKLFNWCMAHRRREQLTALSRAVSRSADGWLYMVFLAAFIVTGGQEGVAFANLAVMAFFVERILYLVMKNTCRRNRPQDALESFTSFVVPSDKFSFPSGHTSAAFLFMVLVVSQFPALFPFLLIWSCSVALSRIFLGVHFPTDTVVGASLGSLVAFWALGGLTL